MNFQRMRGFGLIATLLFCLSSAMAEEKNPNVIIIICDDLNDAIEGMGGHPQALTPSIDKLAGRGIHFTNAHCNAPICGPSRASLWTGMYPSKTGYYGYDQQNNRWREFPRMKEATTIMEHFKNNGYDVYGSGKVFHNGHEDNSVFNQPLDGGPSSFGPAPWDGVSMHPYGKPKGAGHPSMPPKIQNSFWGGFGPISDIPTVGSYTGWMQDWAAPWIFKYESESDRDQMPDEITAEWVAGKLEEQHDKPFFIVAGMNRPHAPFYAPAEFFDMFSLDTLELPPYLENDLEDCPPVLWKNIYQSKALPNFLAAGEETEIGSQMWWKKWVQAYLACVAFVDHQVGVIADALEASPFAENTIVILTGDHGYHMGEKNYMAKTTIWEESTRVPFIVLAPGISSPGTACHHPVSLIDVYPTLIDIAELPSNPNKDGNGFQIDGHSIRPFLEDPSATDWDGRPVALNHLMGPNEVARNTPSAIADNHHSVRSGRYRYTLTSDGQEEFYDHAVDPNEWNNLARTDLDDSQKIVKDWLEAELLYLTGRGAEPEIPVGVADVILNH